MFEIIFLVSFLLIQDVVGVSFLTQRCISRMRVSGINTFLALSLRHATVVNQSSCWVCTYSPFTSRAGIPLRAIPFNQSEMLDIWRDINWYKANIGTNWGEST